jgi:hypothetical protein
LPHRCQGRSAHRWARRAWSSLGGASVPVKSGNTLVGAESALSLRVDSMDPHRERAKMLVEALAGTS